MTLKKHQHYKNTNIQWLGQIPQHWEVKRIKDLGLIKYGLGQPPREKEGGLPIIRATNVERGKINEKKLIYVDANDVPYNRDPVLKENDIIVVRSGAYTADSAIIPKKFEGAITGYDMVFRPIYVNPIFVSFSLLSDYLCRDQLIQASLRAAQPHLNKEELGSGLVAVPPLSEQTAIANYLDQKTAQIDKKVALLTQKIEKYKEFKKSLINETVCRGLDKSVSLKPSNIAWIGDIPEHWEVKRLKDVGFLYGGLSGKGANDFNQENNINNKGFIPFVNIANNQYIKKDHLGSVVVLEDDRQNKVKKSDLFFLMSSESYADIGKTALLLEDIEDTYLNSFCKGFRITNRFMKPIFLNYLMSSFSFRDNLIVEGKGFTRINLKIEKINDFKAILPPLTEQTAIAQYLDEKTHKIDQITANLSQQIATLKELRKTLINEVVTGKVKV